MSTSTDAYLCRSNTGGTDRAYMEEISGQSDWTDSGTPITHRTALRLNPVWGAVQLVSGDVAKIPLHTYQRTPDIGDRARKLAVDHPAEQLVRWKANTYMSAFRFWRRMMVHLLLWNRAYAVIERDEQYRPIGLWPLLPDRTGVTFIGDAPVYVSEVGGYLKSFDDADILNLEGIALSDDVYDELDLVRNARDSFSLALSQQRYNSFFFRNGANTGGILTIPPEFSEDAAKNLIEGVVKKHSRIDNAFKTMVLRDGAKFSSTQVNPEQSQLLASRQESVRDVARWFGIPSHKLGDSSKTSYSSLSEENRSYIDSSLAPWLVTIATQCYMKLLTKVEQDSGLYYFEHDASKFIEADTATKYAVAEIGLRAGILSPNEVRADLNMNPRPDGHGDEFYYSNNMQQTGAAKPTDEPQDDPQDEPAPADEPTDDPPADVQPDELEEATRCLYAKSLARLQDRVRTGLERLARKRPDAAYDELGEVRSQYITDLSEYAVPLAMLTHSTPSEMAERSADHLFAGLDAAMKVHLAAVRIEENILKGNNQ